MNGLNRLLNAHLFRVGLTVCLMSFSFVGKADHDHDLTPVSVQVNWNHQFQFAGFYAALMQGYYEEAGMDVHLHSWKPGMKVLDEVLSGHADFGVGYGSMVADYAKGAPIKLVMSAFQFSPMVILSHDPVSDWSDLSGKTLMHYGNMQIMSLLERIQSKLSSPLKEVTASGDLNDFAQKRVDLYAAYVTNEPFRLKQMGVPFYTLDPKTYGVHSYGDLVITSRRWAQQHPLNVQKFKQATIRGWEYALAHPQKVIDYLLRHFPTVKSREALLNEAKETVKFVRSGQVPIGHIEPAKLMATAAEAKEAGLLTQAQFDALNMQDFIFDELDSVFTQEELAYLATHPQVKLANDIDWEPFEHIDDDGRYQGIAADYFALLSQKLGIEFVPNKTQLWSEAMKSAKSGLLEVFSCAVATPERREYMQFTEPYLSFPMVLAGRKEMTFIKDYSQLQGEKVAVVEGYWSHETLSHYYPGIELVVVKSVKEGLEALIDGRVQVYSGNLGAINFALQKYGLTGVHIVGQSDHRFELAIGVHKSHPVLFSVLQKGLASISEVERQAIFNRWIRLEVVNRLDQQQLYKIGGAVLAMLLVLLAFLLVYRYQKNKQKAYIEQIHELTYATLIDFKTMNLVWVSDSFCKLTGYDKPTLLQMNYLNLTRNWVTYEKRKQILAHLASGQAWSGEIQGETKQGAPYWAELTLNPVKNVFGDVKQLWATRVDITDRKRNERLSITDELTGLFNRRYFNRIIDSEMNRAKRQHKCFYAASLDIDMFKKINDSYGHQRGDEVLAQFAKLLKTHFNRGGDFVFRMGGEEFFVISDFDSEGAFERYLNNVREATMALGVQNQGSAFGVLTISVGAGCFKPERLTDSGNLYHELDACLYEAKAQGRNRVVMSHFEV